jgi:tetratricopeptide (TPR) repeat protein
MHHRAIGPLILMLLAGSVYSSGLWGFCQVPNSTTASQPETAEDQKPQSRYELVRNWRTAAEEHKAGEPDSAAKKIGGWGEIDIKFVFDFLQKLTSQSAKNLKHSLAKAQIRGLLNLNDKEEKQGDLSRLIKQGILLHTDIALLDVDTASNQSSGIGMGFFADGGVVQIKAETRHWEFARQLIDLLPPDNGIAQKWYALATEYMQSRRLQGYAAQNLKRALEKFPSDGTILFYSGVLHENLASPANQNQLLPLGTKANYGSRESELKLARNYFERSIALNPDFAEARMRLGRILGLLGNHSQSIAELQKAAASLQGPPQLYYASLFLGSEFESISRKEEAREQYEKAAKLYPAAQSPLFALSRLSGRNGDSKGALEAVQQAFGLTAVDSHSDDPWWTYDLSHVHNSDRLAEEIRKIFPGGRQ